MAEYYSARISFNVAYRAKEGEVVAGERSEGLAQTMLAVLRHSPKIKVVDPDCAGVEEVEETYGLAQSKCSDGLTAPNSLR